MTDHKKNTLPGKGAKGHLLLSEAEDRRKTVSTQDAADAPAAEKSSDSPVSDEARFLEHITRLAKDMAAFGVMSVRIDGYGAVPPPNKSVSNIAGIIGTICKKAEGAWLKTGKDIFGCYLPDADEKKCRDAANEMCRQISGETSETVSIGIALYPEISFEKKDIYGNAKKALDHADFFGPGSIVRFDAVSLNISGDSFYQAGKIDAAMAEYELALALDPENVNVHNSIGVCHGDRKDLDKALASFSRAVELDPEDVFAIYNAGYIYMQKEEYQTALDYFQRAVKMDENVFELLFQTGRALYELGRADEALSYIYDAISKNDAPGPLVYRTIGDCSLATGNMDDAIKAYNTALKLRPDDAHSLSALAFCYESENSNPEIALVFGENAVEIDPKNGLFHHRLALMYFSRNRLEEALIHFEAAVECGHDESVPYRENTREMIDGNTKQENIAGS